MAVARPLRYSGLRHLSCPAGQVLDGYSASDADGNDVSGARVPG